MATLNCSRLFYDVNTIINQFFEQALTIWKRQHKKQHSKNETRSLDLTRTHAKAHLRPLCCEPEQCLPAFWLHLFLSPWRCLPSLRTQKPTAYPCSLFLSKHLSWVIFLKQWAAKINEAEVLLKAWAWNKDLWAVVSRSQHGRVSLGLEMLTSMTSLIRNQFLPPPQHFNIFIPEPTF